MSKTIDKNGVAVGSDDPKRLLWYSASCGYWTDDWDKLGSASGIPCCPTCGCPGMQIDAESWFEGAREFDQGENLGYQKFLIDAKEKCFRAIGGFMAAWKRKKIFEAARK